MLLATELAPPSQVSTRDVSYPSPSHNIPLDQYNVIRNGSGVPLEPAKIFVAMTNVSIAVNDGQEAASAQKHKLNEQIVSARCSTSRTGCYG